ncbi:MAG: hypothetical protein EP330_11870 [Deltaproteobacteria bacterium]|nr:MAG: hypothetical protein EP330_11870 [Deltaproteobacteria bacterium]
MTTRDPLIEALVRGFPTWEDRNKLARAAQIRDPQLTGTDYAVWEGLLEEALAQGRTHALAAAIDAAGRPKLAEAVKNGGLPDSRPRWAVLGAVLMGSALFLFLFYVTLDPGKSSEWRDERGAETESRMPVQPRKTPVDHDHEEWPDNGVIDHVRAERPPGRGRPTAADPAAGSGDEPAPSDPEPDPGTEAPAPAAVTAPASGEPTGWGSCTAPPGQRIGYAWAGASAPADPWRPDGRVNVREDYPREANGWDTKSRTVCILPEGVTIPLAEGSIAVDGGAVYVPVVAPEVP